MATVKHVEITLHEMASKSYGRGLWDKVALIAEGTVSNTMAKALAVDADPRTLVGPAMYWQKNKFGDVQLVIKYAGEGWTYASPLRDKDGDPLVSEDNKYEIHEVKSRSVFEIPGVTNADGGKVVIEKGFTTLKAYAL